MSELQNFFHMGGYAWYVWPSFLITLIVLLANVWISRIQYRQVVRDSARRAKANLQSRSHPDH